MRRALATLLLAVLNFPLFAVLLVDGSESNVPACCRRNGQHHCAMTAQSGDSTGRAFRPVATCAEWPKAETPFTNLEGTALANRFCAGAAVASWVDYRSINFVPSGCSFESIRKRGPPSCLD